MTHLRRSWVLVFLLAFGCDGSPPIPPLPDTGPPSMDAGPDGGPALACDNGVRDGDETSIDCGGSCEPCEPGDNCRADEDCMSQVCSRGFCLQPTCTDEVRNGDEVGVDCGGSCGLCPGGQPCTVNGDCLSNRCRTGGICAEATCEDTIRNGEETDVDCGGPTCPPCASESDCVRPSDCASGACEGGVCT